jgi:murein L,D-transpeptidase YcbB/YkuD
MRRNHHDVVHGRLRNIATAFAVALCCAVFSASSLQAEWGGEEYGDIFASQSKSQPKRVESSVTTRGGDPVAALVVQQHSARAIDTELPGVRPKPQAYRSPDAGISLYPRVSPLGNSSMQNESIKRALGHYRSASNKEKLKRVYKGVRNKIVWSRSGRATRDANAAIQILSDAASQGLNPAEYHVDEILQAQQQGDMTLFDLLLTDNTLHYISHLRDGQYNPHDVDPLWQIKHGARADLVESMVKALKSKRVSRLMNQVEPRHAVYRSLSRHLNDYISIAQSGGWPAFPLRGRGLKPGSSGSDVKKLRARLAVTDGADLYAPQSSRFDNNLKLAVERFQRRHGLNADGVIGGRTRQALAISVKQRIRQINASMERWRWMPGNVSKRAVIVNVPAFRLYFRENGIDKLTMRTIVGKAPKDLQTPTFTTNMKYMVLNPNWNVPNAIVSEEMAPKADRWPRFFQDNGYKVTDEAGNIVDPSSVDWGQYSKSNPAPFNVVQARGGDGALGSVKFIFPNQYGVALHDTQRKNLFEEEFRAYSHGCVRVEKPSELGAAILGYRNSEQFISLVERSSEDERINLQQDIPVYMVYMTAWADADEIYFYEDIYQRDRRLVQAKTSKRG